MRRRSYAILGTGALGGFYGARLQRAGCDVHFLLRSDYEHVRRHGLIVESKDGDFTLPRVEAHCDTATIPPCDVVVVALKTTQNQLLAQLLPPLMANGTVVLDLQNGLGNEELIAGLVGAERVVGGLCFLCSNKVGPGHIRHLDYGLVALGEFSRQGTTDRLRSIGADFAAAGVPVQYLDDLRVGRWQKLVWNIPYNGLSVMLDATTTELMLHPATRVLTEAIMREVVTGANACGVPLPMATVTEMLERTAKMTPYKTSMKLDFDAGRPMELAAIFGNPLRAAQQAGAPSPLVGMLYEQLRFLDGRNRGPR
jgi:2-dehydropantoate 2-reductase